MHYSLYYNMVGEKGIVDCPPNKLTNLTETDRSYNPCFESTCFHASEQSSIRSSRISSTKYSGEFAFTAEIGQGIAQLENPVCYITFLARVRGSNRVCPVITHRVKYGWQIQQ